jgi:hypothetical protein
LKLLFPEIFRCFEQQQSETVTGCVIHSNFSRSVGPIEMEECEDLQDNLRGVNLSENEDVVRWEFEGDGKFSTKSTYRFIQNPGFRDSRMMDMWSINCPLKHFCCCLALF